MQISRDSWHYKFLGVVGNKYDMPERFCPYMRTLILKLFLVSMASLFLAGLVVNFFYTGYELFAVGFHEFYKTHPGNVNMFLAVSFILGLGGVLLGLVRGIGALEERISAKDREKYAVRSTLWEDHWKVLLDAWVAAGEDWDIRPDYTLEYEKFMAQFRKPRGLFRTYAHALHSKICPTVNFVGNAE